MSAWGVDMEAGFMLAALLADDRNLARVHGALAERAEVQLRAQLDQARSASQAQLVTALLAAIRPPLTALPSGLPPRLGALLAPRAPRPLAQRLIADAPLARAGFAPPSDLLPRLLRIARHRGRSRGAP